MLMMIVRTWIFQDQAMNAATREEEGGSTIRLPDDYNPFDNLDHVERLLNFKITETDQ